MLDQERCMEIRILSKQGKSIKEICRLKVMSPAGAEQ